MNIKRLGVIIALLCLSVVNANARQITINVPVALTNVPAANTIVIALCQLNNGTAPAGGTSREIRIPENRNYSGIATVSINSAKATRYTCRLANQVGEPTLASSNSVEGDIPQ